MSSTDDALDMDVLRRAVGDRKLTYVGQSYGSYLGLVYANMFPGRVRAMVIDGIVDPQALAGTPATSDVPVFDRIGSAAASDRALHELLELCQQAGRSRCSFASADTATRSTVAGFGRLATRLHAHPLRLTAPGVKAVTFSYADLVADTEHWLHNPSGYRGLIPELTGLARLTSPGGGGRGRAAVVRAVLRLHLALQPGPAPANQLEAESGVYCADSLSVAGAASWPAAAAAGGHTAAMTAWRDVEQAEPEFAARVRRLFDAGRHKTIATLRADGSPRISGIECEFADGELRFGSMPGARKGADLRRDPRFALHGPTVHPVQGKEAEWPGEAKIAGRAVLAGPVSDGPAGDQFLADIAEIALTRLNPEASLLVIESWTPHRGLRVVERE